MITGSAILAWLSSYGIGILLKFAADFWFRDRTLKSEKELGRLEVVNKVNTETTETKNAMESVVRPTDDAVADSLRTGKF